MALRRGDVVVVSMPSTNGTGAEIRLGVVISASQYHKRDNDIIVAGIVNDPPRNDNEVALRDWEAAHLLKPSTVRPKPFTTTRANVLRSPGRLSDLDMAEVERMLRWALQL